ncbi:hypothetical protein DL98DRAFT_513683 [Cadophora sp. DSE1049]|nr:hypothetical protein DL98DRAFT_513683 [Cadophora sp. DSE1049]
MSATASTGSPTLRRAGSRAGSSQENMSSAEETLANLTARMVRSLTRSPRIHLCYAFIQSKPAPLSRGCLALALTLPQSKPHTPFYLHRHSSAPDCIQVSKY